MPGLPLGLIELSHRTVFATTISFGIYPTYISPPSPRLQFLCKLLRLHVFFVFYALDDLVGFHHVCNDIIAIGKIVFVCPLSCCLWRIG